MNQAELRQTFNTISRNLESANEAAQENIYSFTSHYIDPCLGSIKACFVDCTAPCFPEREDQVRRRRAHSRSRIEFDFDFYDDWEADEAMGRESGWGNDELDSLLAGRGQPQAQRAMSYGTRARRLDPESDPTAIPKSAYLGFLERLPFKLGARVLHYRPSAAGLQENPGGLRIRDVEAEALMGEGAHVEGSASKNKGHTRNRSDTDASRSTHTSHSARSDLIMSDEEDDAQPLDDEFATVMLSRRTTGLSDEQSSKASSGKRPNMSRVSTRTFSNRSLHVDKTRRSSSRKSLTSLNPVPLPTDVQFETQSMVDLKKEEEQLKEEEELEIIQKRRAALKLAVATGLSSAEAKDAFSDVAVESETATPNRTPSRDSVKFSLPMSPRGDDDSEQEVEPFPTLEFTTRASQSNDKPP